MINITAKQASREGNVELIIKGHKVSVKQDEHALEFYCSALYLWSIVMWCTLRILVRG